MTAPWMPPLPEPDVIVHYTADQMRRAQQDAARAALEQAIQACEAEYTVEGIAQRCADAIRALAREVQHD